MIDQAVASPPPFADPRRIGAVIGLVGACNFVFSYAGGIGKAPALVAKFLVSLLALTALGALFVIPKWLGPFVAPRGWAIGVYGLCVVGEIALIGTGSKWLTASDKTVLRPALIALVVGLHFLPFAWAFKERMFYVLGGALVLFGLIGLLFGTETGALMAAVASGLVMAALISAYAWGVFARPAGDVISVT